MSRRSRPTQRAHIVPVESSTEDVLVSILGTSVHQMEEGDAAMALPVAETKDKDAAKRKQKKLPNFEEMCRELTETLSQPPRKNKGRGKKTKKTEKEESDRPPTPQPRFTEPIQYVQVSDQTKQLEGPKIEKRMHDLNVNAPEPPEPRSLAPVQTSTLLSATPTTPTIVCSGLLLLFTLMFLLSDDIDEDGSDDSDGLIDTLNMDDIAELINCQRFLY